MTGELFLYGACFAVAATISFFLTPLIRMASLRSGILDLPNASVKTHRLPTPVFGGVAIWAGFAGAMLLLRSTTNFPTGTLYNLRALMLGSTLIFLLGLADDLRRPAGLDYKSKFLVQFLATAVLIIYGLRIRFINPPWVAVLITSVWVVGITNAFNIIDVMDGLSSSQASIAAAGFLLVSLPSELAYVNFAAAAIAGAAAGFLPWNVFSRQKIFMGDCGSLTLGFLLASVSLGARYSKMNDAGVFAPILILFVPLFDTVFVSILRLNRGQSPFKGSKDHFALRLESMGHSRLTVVAMAGVAAAFCGICAFLATQSTAREAIWIYAFVGAVMLAAGIRLSLVKMP